MEKNIILCLSSWGGLGDLAGTSKINIYENGDIEEVNIYTHHPDMNSDLIVKKLDKRELDILNQYIETELVDKLGIGGGIYDAGFNIMVNYKGKIYISQNEHQKYKNVRKFIEALKGKGI